jgi:hypothetical protein
MRIHEVQLNCASKKTLSKCSSKWIGLQLCAGENFVLKCFYFTRENISVVQSSLIYLHALLYGNNAGIYIIKRYPILGTTGYLPHKTINYAAAKKCIVTFIWSADPCCCINNLKDQKIYIGYSLLQTIVGQKFVINMCSSV